MNKKIFAKTFGCQMNEYDTNRIIDTVKKIGFTKTENLDDTNCFLLNTCHIRDKAKEKVYHEIGRVKKRFRLKKKPFVIVAGCVAQAENEEMLKREPFIDLVIGPQAYHKINDKIEEYLNNQRRLDETDFDAVSKFNYLDKIKNSSTKISSFLTIQEGCDKFCHFCVVPYTRGPEFSRPIDDIINETKKYLSNGVKEIILLGQNVNAYHGNSTDGKSRDLSYLINTIAEIDEVKRIRYMTSHPIDMTDSLIKVHASNPKLMPFLHLPIQSGSDSILKKMNRKHTVSDYLKIVDKIRTIRPDIAISSDFIVGFPDETDEDFEKTMKFIEKVNFVIAYSFTYSPRPGTPAQHKDNIDQSVKKARLSALQSLLTEQQLNYNKSFINKDMEVLFEKEGRYKNQFIGRTIYNQSTFIESNEKILNKILKVKITNSTNFALECQI